MKRFLNWQVLLGISLVALSAVLYLLHYAIFRDSHHIFIYLLGDIAFVPIEVLLVTLIIHRLLNAREKRAMLKKMNMVVGVFFNEVGITLLKLLSVFDPQSGKLGVKTRCCLQLVGTGIFNGEKNMSRAMIAELIFTKAIFKASGIFLSEKEGFYSPFCRIRICWSMNFLLTSCGL